MATQTIHDWLKGIQLDCYAQLFESSGYFDLTQCISLTEDNLNAIGVGPLGHRKRILAHLPDADILFGLVPAPPPQQLEQCVDYVNLPDGDDYVNVQDDVGNVPALPPKTDRPAESLRPKPAPRNRRSVARSRAGSDMKETEQEVSSLSENNGQRKRPVPQPRARMSPGLKQKPNDSSAGSFESESLADSRNSQTFEKSGLKSMQNDLVCESSKPIHDTQSPDIELASPEEMKIFKIGMDSATSTEDKTEKDFLSRLAEIETQINADLLDLDKQMSDDSDDSDTDGVGQPQTAVSVSALSGETETVQSSGGSVAKYGVASDVNRWQDNNSGGHALFNTQVPLPQSFNMVGNAQASYDVPKSTLSSSPALTGCDVPNTVVPLQPCYDIPSVPVPVRTREDSESDEDETYDVPPPPQRKQDETYDVPPSPLQINTDEDQTYDVPNQRGSDIYEPIWIVSSQAAQVSNSDQQEVKPIQTNALLDSFGTSMTLGVSQTLSNSLPPSFPDGSSADPNQGGNILDFSPPVRNFEQLLPEPPKLRPMPAELTEFDPLQNVDTTVMRSAGPLENVGEDEIYDAPPPSFAPPALPTLPVRKAPPPPVPPRITETLPETLGQKSDVVENVYIEGSFDEFSKLRAESTTSSLGSRNSMPVHPPPPVPLMTSPMTTPTRIAPPPPIMEEYSLLDRDPFSSTPPKPQMPFKVASISSSPKGRLDSDDELGGGVSTDDNLSLSDGGEFMESCEDLHTVSKMVGMKPAISQKRIPITQATSSQRTVQRSGFLFKQDSGQRILSPSWTKRWVVFNGDDLRYYEEKKSMVSKRIIPVAVMRNVENEIKQGDSKPNRFKLKTVDRMYIFAADKIDDLFLWTNTLMEAIITNQGKGIGSLPEGLWMNSPDREGFLKMDGMKGKVFVAIKGEKLCYYNNKEDFKVGSPIHQIDMKLCAVKEVGKNKIQLPTNYKTFNFTCESIAETHMWKKAMEDAVAEGLSDTKVVGIVYENESNQFCADCDASDPSWASINLAIVMCKRCAGIHRQLHTPASKVRSLKLDTKVWTPTVIKLFHMIGNKVANEFWIGMIQGINKISPESDDLSRQQFIETKYQERKYCKFHHLKDNMEALDEALCKSALTEDVAETMKLIFSGANMMYISDKYAPPMTSLQLAKKEGKTLQAEFLYHNGAEAGEKVTPGRRNSDNYRRRIVTHKGYLYKTGANQKAMRCRGYLYKISSRRSDFLKRWCILEHCTLCYYQDEKSMTAKDSIESKDMISLCVTKVEKQEYPFELNTTKYGGRIYLFGAESEEARQEWMKRVAQSFSPSDAISLINDFTKAGYVFLRDGVATSWVQCWLQLRGKELAFFSESDQQFDGADVRKLVGSKRFEENGCAECFEKGFHFVMDFPGRAWYIQADSVVETESWYSLIDKCTKESGNSLAEQQLTSENVPIIVEKCLSFVAAHGIQVQGIYRLNGTHSKINRLLQDFHNDARSVHLKLEDYEVHDVANCLKRFFRTLNDPLLTCGLHKNLVEAAALTDHDSKLQFYHFYLSKLPSVNYITLRKVIMHLNSVSEQECVNKMGVTNLASIFGPALMVVDQGENTGYGSTNHEIACLADLILYHKWLFDIQDTERHLEEKIQMAQEKIKRAATVKGHGGDIMIPIYIGKKALDRSHNQRIPATKIAQEVVDYIVETAKLPQKNWALFEVICNDELERVIHNNEMVLPILMNWSHWDPEYSATSYLCVKENNLYDKLDLVLDPTLSLFSELKLSEKKSFKKFYFEFKQSKLAYYKSAQASNPVASWNVEDLLIYIGAESKRSTPTNWNITFIKASEKVTRNKDTPFFGRTMSCNAADEMYRWMASMISAQHPEGLFPPRPLKHSMSAPGSSHVQGAAANTRGQRVLPDISEIKLRKTKMS
ncbi:arf-GAP with Rho-GAP domain, ANK repeat and PH domain-containing protein 1-like isoform X2 [Lineus longissimus]|uniref:arf-GAP with Rho-GAP domain, ANK repeat and PH domain-containing protein 1-like isoform X2 n=1 Tax=Lineus longissimus TaxID=88925 RepID=UPI00315D0E07